MLASLLVGIDGSSESHSALQLSLRWARSTGALVKGLGVIDEPGLHGSEEYLMGELYFRKLHGEILSELRAKAADALKCTFTIATEAGARFEALQDEGVPYAEIVREAQACDLVLLGQHTHFRFGWEDRGDATLSQVLANSSRPVVAVPEQVAEGEAIVIAYDGSLQAARALAAFEALGLVRDQEVHVLSADPDWKAAARCADRAVEFLYSHKIKPRPHPLPSHSPAETILDWVFRLRAGLVVMGAYGKPTLQEFILGSVT
ncbi:MAG TPA: universal stress protein, partial [Isosphaeraceae bacterium]|nr:universal stress protein [Isosphaeraceae bacterium]